MEVGVQVNDRSVFGADPRVAQGNEGDRVTCYSRFYRSVRMFFCCQCYLPESDGSGLLVTLRMPFNNSEVQLLEEQGVRITKIQHVVHQYLSSLENPSEDECQEIWNIAISHASNIETVDGITVQNIFGLGDVERKKQAELRRVNGFESNIKPYRELKEFYLELSVESDQIECALSLEKPQDLIRYQGAYCNYMLLFIIAGIWGQQKDVDLDQVVRVVMPSGGLVFSAFESDEAKRPDTETTKY